MEAEASGISLMKKSQVSRGSAERIELLQTVTSLQKVALEYDVPLHVPTLFVVGSQSRGKSSLVEAMAGLTFNFCGNDIASRFPINFTMINDSSCSRPSWTLIEGQKKTPNLRTSDISSRVAARNMTLHQRNTVSSKPMHLELHWDRCSNLSFMDLPGLRAFAVDEEEKKLKQQIEQMVQSIIQTYAHHSNVHFLVVEDAKEDVANYHGLSQIGHMLSSANQKPAPPIHEEIPDMFDEFEPVEEEIEAAEIPDMKNRFFLVLNKFDNFLKSQDTSHSDKTKKIESVISKFGSREIPVFFTSLPNTAEKKSFVPMHYEGSPEELEKVLFESFATALLKHSESDCTEMNHLVEDYNGPVGFMKLKKFLENMMMKQYRAALPNIRTRLINKQNELLQASGMGDKESQEFLQQNLPSICSRFSSNIQNFLEHDFPSRIQTKRLTMEQEYQEMIIGEHPEQENENPLPPRFSYHSSAVWRNKKFNTELCDAIYAEIPLFGGAQITRLISEFQICIHCMRGPSLGGDDFKAKVIEHRLAVNRHIGGGLKDWTIIISELLQESCSELLGRDIELFARRLKMILIGWFDAAWLDAISSFSASPVHLKDEMKARYILLIDSWSGKMKKRMEDFVEYSIRDYNPATFERQVKQISSGSSTTSPSASHLFSSIMEQIAPGKHLPMSASSLLESRITDSSLYNHDLAHGDDVFDLQLHMHDRPEDPVVLEKLRTICSYQVQFGSERIRATFRFIFESMFKRPLCTKLNLKLVGWSTKLPDILKERLREDSIMLQDIEHHISLISKIIT